MTLADTAAEIAEEFGAVFPCKANKAPLTTHGFKDASDDPDIIYKLFSKAPEAALIGIATGDIVVVDIDRKNGKDGFRWPALAELPLTRTQRTPSGGEHRLYRVPLGRRLRCSQNAVYPGIDIRGDGGYIATGPGYRWTNDEDIATLSEAQCELLTRPAKMPMPQEGVTAADIAGIDHGNWHEPVLRLVGKLVAKGIDDQTIFSLTDRFTLSGYTVAQTRLEVAEMIRGAREKGWAPEVPETRYPPFQSPLDVFTAEPPEWRVDGILPKRGVGIIVGGEGSGKTFVAIDIAMAVANGTPFAKNHPTQGGRVLYSAAEDRHGVGSRIVAHHQWSTLSVSNIALWQGISLVDLKDIEYLEQTGERFDLVIIDTLSKATPGLDENSNSEMAGAVARAYQLSALWDCFVLLVAHTGKEAGKGVRGASSLTANVDTVLKCVRPGRGSQVSLTLTKQKSGPEDAAVDFALEEVEVINPRTGEVSGSLVVRPTKASAPDMCRRALASEHDLTAKAVFDRVTRHSMDPSNPDVTLNAVKAALSRMVSAGEAINNAGKYSLTAGGEDE
jgi:hypothetical protein